jgi:CubicO group peptidase (beta-lactamase class C family)
MPVVDQSQLKVRVDEILGRWPAVGLAMGVVHGGSVDSFCRGVADVVSKELVTDDTVFRIGSISKTFTAIAVMQLWERGRVDLDGPANDYLRTFHLVAPKAGWRPATVRHLLTHTAGVPQWVHPTRMIASGWFGESVSLGQPLPTLAEYYGGSLRLAVQPGTTCTYTDHGFAVLGQLVEDVSGQPLHRYLREHVFDPLGMVSTDLRRSGRIQAHLATGYRLGPKGPKAVTDRQWITTAASSVYSTPRDMARYLAALVDGGADEPGAVLRPETLAMMFEPHYQPDPRIPGVGPSFFRMVLDGHPAVEHQGVLPGFNSQIILAPRDGVGVLAFTNGAGNASARLLAEAQRLLGDTIGAAAEAIRTDVPHHPEIWGDICGWYRPRAQPTDMMAWSMLGAGVRVGFRHGQLVLRTRSPLPGLYRGLPLYPDDDEDPYVFRLDLSRYGMGTARVVFSHDPVGARTRVHLDGLPLSAERRPDAEHRSPWAFGRGVVARAAEAEGHRDERVPHRT